MVLVERRATGGQAGQSSLIENYLGFPDGISGSQLTQRAHRQAQKFGAEILTTRDVVGLDLRPSSRAVRCTDGGEIVGHAVLLATGISYSKLDVPGADELDRPGPLLRLGGHGSHRLRRRRGLHRRRCQLRRSSGGVLRPSCSAGHVAGASARASRRRCRTTWSSRSPRHPTIDVRLDSEVTVGRRGRPPRSAERPPPQQWQRRDPQGRPPVRLHRCRPAHGMAR